MGHRFACRVVEPGPEWRLLPAPERTLGLSATDPDVKMIRMGVTAARFVKDPGRTKDDLRGGLVHGSVSQEPRLDRSRAEDPFDPRFEVGDETSDERPVARVVEHERTVIVRRDAVLVERQPVRTSSGDAAGISGEKDQVCIAARAMASMAFVRTAPRIGEVPDPKRVPARKRCDDGSRGSLDRVDQRSRSVSRIVPRPHPNVSRSTIGKRDRLVEVPLIGRPDRDRLVHGQRYARARARRKARPRREQPHHVPQDSSRFRLTSRGAYVSFGSTRK